MWHICCRQCWLLQLAGTGKLAEGSSGAWGPSTVQALNTSKLGTSASAPGVSHWWFKPCEFQCSSLNFGSWEPLYWKENVYLIMSGKECLSHLQQLEKKNLVWPFCCTEKWDTGRENCCSLWLCGSNLGAIWNDCAHANATTWAWAWPCSLLANCWVFLHVRSSVWAWSISWVREKTEAVRCWLRGSVGELSGTGLGFNWHLTKPCLGRSPAVAPWSSTAFPAWAGSALAHHGRQLAAEGE